MIKLCLIPPYKTRRPISQIQKITIASSLILELEPVQEYPHTCIPFALMVVVLTGSRSESSFESSESSFGILLESSERGILSAQTSLTLLRSTKYL